jgi:hypothetical protein
VLSEAWFSAFIRRRRKTKNRLETNNLFADELIRSQREEIEKYRWIESEKAGRDIGWERASEEWKQKHFSTWRQDIRQRGVEPSLFEILWSQQQEIETYKWIESEKDGRDIGWQQAVTEWQDRHYHAWRDHVWTTSLSELGRVRQGPEAFPSKPVAEKRRRSFSAEHRENLALAMRAWHEKRKARRQGED